MDDYDKYSRLYESRKGSIQEIIDALAQTDNLDDHGVKSEIAHELGVDPQRVYYVVDKWKDLVAWRRHAGANPLDKKAVQEAYEDETLKAMAGNEEIVADGYGEAKIDVALTLDQIFRCVKILPGDLGMEFFSQMIQKGDEIPKEVTAKMFQEKDK